MRTGQQEAGGPWGLELTGPNRPEPRFEPPVKRQQEATFGFSLGRTTCSHTEHSGLERRRPCACSLLPASLPQPLVFCPFLSILRGRFQPSQAADAELSLLERLSQAGDAGLSQRAQEPSLVHWQLGKELSCLISTHTRNSYFTASPLFPPSSRCRLKTTINPHDAQHIIGTQ